MMPVVRLLATLAATFCFNHAQAITVSLPEQPIRSALQLPLAGVDFASNFYFPATIDLAEATILSAWLEGAGTELLALRENNRLALLADICPGRCSSVPTHMVALNDRLVFSAYAPSTGRRLWTSDGSKANTQPVFEASGTGGPALASPPPALSIEHSSRAYLKHGGFLYFAGTTSAYGYELWQTDGTAAGTTRLTDINPGSSSSDPRSLFTCGSSLCFSARDEERRKLWLLTSDYQLQAIPEPANTTFNRILGGTSTHLFWSAETDAGADALVSYDLASSSSSVLQNFDDFEPPKRINKAVSAGNDLYLHIKDEEDLLSEIWISNGSQNETTQLAIPLDDAAYINSILAPISAQLLLSIRYPSSNAVAMLNGETLSVIASFSTDTILSVSQQLDDSLILIARSPIDEQNQFVRISEEIIQQNEVPSFDVDIAHVGSILGGSQQSRLYFYYSFSDEAAAITLKKLDFDTNDQSLSSLWQTGPLAERTLMHNGALFYQGSDGKLYRGTRRRISMAESWFQGYAPDDLIPFTGGADISLFRADDQIWGLPANSLQLLPVYDGAGKTIFAMGEMLFASQNEEAAESTLFAVLPDGDILPVIKLPAPERFMSLDSTYSASTTTHWLVSIANGSSYRLIAIDRQSLEVTGLDMFESDQPFRVSSGPADLFAVQTYDTSSYTTSLWLTDGTLTGYEKVTEFSGTPQQSAVIIPGESLALLFAQQSGTSQQIMRMTYGGSASPLTDESGAALKNYGRTVHVEDGVYLTAHTTGNNPTLWKVTETGPAIPVLAGLEGPHNGPTLIGPVEGGILFESSDSKGRRVYSLSEQPASSSSGSSNIGYLALLSLLLFRLRRKLS